MMDDNRRTINCGPAYFVEQKFRRVFGEAISNSFNVYKTRNTAALLSLKDDNPKHHNSKSLLLLEGINPRHPLLLQVFHLRST